VTRYYGCSDSSLPAGHSRRLLTPVGQVCVPFSRPAFRMLGCGGDRYPRLIRHTVATAPSRTTSDGSAAPRSLRTLQLGASACFADWPAKDALSSGLFSYGSVTCFRPSGHLLSSMPCLPLPHPRAIGGDWTSTSKCAAPPGGTERRRLAGNNSHLLHSAPNYSLN